MNTLADGHKIAPRNRPSLVVPPIPPILRNDKQLDSRAPCWQAAAADSSVHQLNVAGVLLLRDTRCLPGHITTHNHLNM